MSIEISNDEVHIVRGRELAVEIKYPHFLCAYSTMQKNKHRRI